MDFNEKRILFLLGKIKGMYSRRIWKMYEYAGSFSEAYKINGEEYMAAGIMKKKSAAEYDLRYKDEARYLREYENLFRQDIKMITYFDEDYPKKLKNIYDPPIVLYGKGKLPDNDKRTVSIIGARACSDYGREAAMFFARELCRNGIQIVSGMAEGIDSAASEGALRGGGESYAILGCGVNICYPRESYSLYERMSRGMGGVWSEYTPGLPALGFHFVQRNRIISGLSDAILVMEAREKSGTGITVEYALEQGKEVFALPGRIDNPLGRGCNTLLKQGASVLTSPDDILDFFGNSGLKRPLMKQKELSALAFSEEIVYSCLDFNLKHAEEISAVSGYGIGETIAILTRLELKGYVVSPQRAYYRKAYE